MKSSHQMLMLAILMGFSAWLLDAVISWYLFPGKTFSEMLWAYDPGRTLFARSAVVTLFFCFGLFVGFLQERLEKQKAIAQENLRFVKGIHSIQNTAFISFDPERMIDEAAVLFRDTFQFEEVFIVSVEPGSRRVLSRHTTKKGEVDAADFKGLEQKVSSATVPFKPSRSSLPFKDGTKKRQQPSEGVQVPLSYQDTLYGYVLGNWKPATRESLSELWQEYFFSACKEIAKSMDHLHQIQESKRKSSEMRSLFDLSPMGIFVNTVSGKPIYSNPALKKLLGHAESTPTPELGPVLKWYENPAKREDLLSLLKKNITVNDFEFQLRTTSGETRTVIISARLNTQIDLKDPHIEGFLLDITHRKSAEASQRSLQQELERAEHFRAITVLAGGVAHEFNNILQAMMGNAYLGKLKLNADQEDVAEFFDDIQSSGKRAAKLCDQMLSYAGKRTIASKLEVMDDALQRLLLILRNDIASDVPITSSLDAQDVRSHLDIPSFSEVVSNLVQNAVEASPLPHGKVELTSSVRNRQALEEGGYIFTRNFEDDDYWVLSVRDNGQGIPEDELPRIFDPFYTTKFQGRGLGLSAAEGIVEKLDGCIGYRSRVNEGSEFLLCLPVAESVTVLEEVEEQVDKSSPQKRPSTSSGQKKIWVVDDEPLIGETVMRILKHDNYEVETENDSTHFLEFFTKKEAAKTDCLLLDLTMPHVSGAEILQAVREHSPDLPIMIMSGYDEGYQKGELEKYQISGFIHKPFRMTELVESLNKVLS